MEKKGLEELANRASISNLFINDKISTRWAETKRPYMVTRDVDKVKLQEIQNNLGHGIITPPSDRKTEYSLIFCDDSFEPIAKKLLPFLARGNIIARQKWEYLNNAINICRLLRKMP